VHDDHLFEATLNYCYTWCFQEILPIALNATYANEQNSLVCFPLVVQLVDDRILSITEFVAHAIHSTKF